jgi:hypothetical protein
MRRRSLARSAMRKAWESICRPSIDPIYRADGLGRRCSEEDKSPAAVSKEQSFGSSSDTFYARSNTKLTRCNPLFNLHKAAPHKERLSENDPHAQPDWTSKEQKSQSWQQPESKHQYLRTTSQAQNHAQAPYEQRLQMNPKKTAPETLA